MAQEAFWGRRAALLSRRTGLTPASPGAGNPRRPLPPLPSCYYLVGMGTLEISLLGGFQLRRDGALLEPIASRAGRSLLAYLVMNRERPHTRDH